MSRSPRVSIITPAFNHVRFIAACLESVTAQTYADWEMTVIDDASGDGTPDVVRVHAGRDSRIRLIRHDENWGMAGLARTDNQALAAGRGEWVAILEGDDIWPRRKLELQLRNLADDPAIILGFGRSRLISPKGEDMGDAQADLPAFHRRCFEDFRGRCLQPLLMRPCFIDPVTVMIRRSALEGIGGFLQPPGLGLVDHPTFLELAQRGPFFGSAAVLGCYRRHGEAQSLRHIVAWTQAERRLAFEVSVRTGIPDSASERRRMTASWAEESVRSFLTEGRLRLLQGRRREARNSFRSGLSAENDSGAVSFRLLMLKAAVLAALGLSVFPGVLERLIGWRRLRSRSRLKRSGLAPENP